MLPSRIGSTVRSRPRTAAALLVCGLMMATVAACSGSGGSDADSSGAADMGGTAESNGARPVDGVSSDEALTSASDEPAPAGRAEVTPALEVDPAQLDPRDIIRTGTLSLVAGDPQATRDRIADLVDALGGYVSDESANLRATDDVDEIRMVLQVPTARFYDALDRISDFGKVKGRTIQAVDVTRQVADIDSRVESARTTLGRVRGLLDRANSLGMVIRLEGVLSNRQADLESLLAQQSALASQTSLGTIEVDVTERRPAVAPKDETDETRGFLDGLQVGWDGLQAAYVGASTVIGAVLPFALLAALIGVPVLLWHRRRISPQPPTPAADPQ